MVALDKPIESFKTFCFRTDTKEEGFLGWSDEFRQAQSVCAHWASSKILPERPGIQMLIGAISKQQEKRCEDGPLKSPY